MRPINLYFTADGKTALRYWTQGGAVVERVVSHPAALVTLPPDATAEVSPQVLDTPEALLFAAFRGMPLAPEKAWRLAEEGFSPTMRATFEAFLRMLRLPPEARWCVRGEPGWFLQFGLREDDGRYTMGAFVLPCGKPAVLTFRAEDLIRDLPPAQPFATMDITSVADGLAEQVDRAMAWDTRVRLPIQDRGAALVTLRPNPPDATQR